MLRVFRQNLKNLSWVLWVVIAVFILLVFVDFGGTVPTGAGDRPSDVAAKVGSDDEVTFGEFQRAYQRAESVYRQAYGDQFSGDLARQIGLPGQVIESLVAEKILRREALETGIEVTDAELQRSILEIPAFQNADGGFVGQDIYSRTLRNAGFTVDQFEASVRADLLTEKLRSVLARSVFVSDQEVEQAYRDEVEKAKIRLVELSTEPLTEELPGTVGDEELAAFFEQRRADYRLPETRSVEYLLVDRAAVQATLEIGDDEVASYYAENQEEFASEEQVRARHILLRVNDERSRDQATAELEAIRGRIEAGEDFAALATELSDDPGSKTRGGDLGFFGRGRMVPAFEEAAFSAEPGSLVGPIVTSFGAHLIRVEEKRPAGVEALDAVRQRIRARLLAERAVTAAEGKALDLAERIETENTDSSETFSALADDDTGVSFVSLESLAEDEAVPGIGQDTAFTVAAFDLEPGAVSEPVKIGRGWAIVRLTAVKEPRDAELADVRDAVEADLQQERRRRQVMADLEAAAERARQGATLEEVAQDLGVEIEETEEFGRGEAVGTLGRSSKIAAEALALDEGAVAGPFEVANGAGAVIFQVAERQRFDPALYAQNRQATRERLENDRLEALIGSVVEKRRQQLEVRYAPELVENFELQPDSPTGS